MSSRIEKRQLEAAMKASMADQDTKKPKSEKAEKPAPSAPAVAKKKPVPPPRAYRGGKSLPQKRRKKAESSDSSSSESDDEEAQPDNDSSSSSSEEEAPKPMPLKKRAKVAAPQESEGSSSEFEDEFDDQLYKGEEDRKWLESLQEIHREQIILERRDKREIAREAWEVKHKAKKQQSAPTTSRAKRAQSKADEKKQQQKAALEDMQAKKQQNQEKVSRLKAVRDESDEEEEDKVEPTTRREEERHPREKEEREERREARRERQASPEPARISIQEMERIKVGRDQLVNYIKEPFFSEFCQGLYVRVNIGSSSSGETKYLLCEIIGVRDNHSEYKIDMPGSGSQKMKLKKALNVTHAGQKSKVLVSQISNKPLDQKEVDRWCRDMAKARERIPDEEERNAKEQQKNKNWKIEFKYDSQAVDAMLEEKQKLKKHRGNIVLNKIHLTDEQDQAWEEYKQTQDEEEKNAAYERWEELRLQVQELEKREQEVQKSITEKGNVSALASINTRNMEANRTIKKSLNKDYNNTMSRPYIRTTYWALGNEDDDDDESKQKENKAETPKAGDAPLKIDVVTTATMHFHDEDDLFSPTAASDAEAAKAKEMPAVLRAHATELAVEVDTVAVQQTIVPFARSVNPLKPEQPATSASGSGKVAITLEDYKRRRGLLN